MVYAQSARAWAQLDTTALLIGDQTHMQLNISVPSTWRVDFPVIGDTINQHIEVLKQSEISQSGTAEYITLTQQLLITSFDSGYHAIAPLTFTYHEPDDTTAYTLMSTPLLLKVNTIPADSTMAIHDIKAIRKAPVTLKEALPWALIALFIIALIILLWRYVKTKKERRPFIPIVNKPQRPPHELALERLSQLAEKKLWQQGEIKTYHTEITDIARDYLEGKFGIQALEMTTEEIMKSLSATPIEITSQKPLYNLLQLADMVKFAKAKPLPDEHMGSFKHLEAFIHETMKENDKADQETAAIKEAPHVQ